MLVINLSGCSLFRVRVAVMIEHDLLFGMLGIFIFNGFFKTFDRAAQIFTGIS